MLWAADVCCQAAFAQPIGRFLRSQWAGFSQLGQGGVSWVTGFVCHPGLAAKWKYQPPPVYRNHKLHLTRDLSMHDSVFSRLPLAYRIMATIPPSSMECERTFSKLKIIKDRLANKITSDHLSGRMILTTEQDPTWKLDYITRPITRMPKYRRHLLRCSLFR